MTTLRVLPPVAVQYQTQRVTTADAQGNPGRSYTGRPGQAFDVPDFDGQTLSANGWIKFGDMSGPTSARPTPGTQIGGAWPGFVFVDSTLNLVAVSDGVNWRSPITGAIV